MLRFRVCGSTRGRCAHCQGQRRQSHSAANDPTFHSPPRLHAYLAKSNRLCRTRSNYGNGLVEQQKLLLIGRLKNLCPPLEVSSCHGCVRPLARGTATFSPLDQLLQGRLKAMQFYSHPQGPCPEAFLISFDSGPVAPFQNDALTPGEELLGKCPQLIFEAHPEFVIPYIATQLAHPPVLIQSDGADFRCKLTSQRRLARGWKPTDQHKPRR
jgi:hypothetical protein